MGQASGKLTISHVDHKTKTEASDIYIYPVETDGDVPQPISTGQIVNGDVTNAPDLPSIDDDVEHVATKSNMVAEISPVHDDHPAVVEHDQNGSVHVEEHDAASASGDKSKEEKQTKKTKNPLVWIHRRLSKRSSTSKKASDKTTEEATPTTEPNEPTEEAAAPVAAVTPEQAESATVSVTPVTAAEHQEVVEVASSLVDQVLGTAMIQQLSEQVVEHTPEFTSATTEVLKQQDQPASESVVEHPACPVEHVVECVPHEQPQAEASPSVEEAVTDTIPEVTELENDTTEHAPEIETESQPELPPQPEEIEKPLEEHMETEHTTVNANNTNAECDSQQLEMTEGTPAKKSFDHEDLEEQLPVDPEQNHVNGHDFEHHDDVVAAKLASLELTNGHSEHHLTTNGVNGTHSDVVVNGD
ncbi:hypothetical protein FGIG_03537 [Fasciola gigantica]|uniref:Uncharacterized protein n=1 Tax=Fasciola gigantica TaxID=46835 RepID=A0A504YW92_FASGI|nr:hypothetical protein FGIG_03537 [Fasciola gigantica]